MKRKCGWCNQLFGVKRPLADRRITYGICRLCLQQLFKEDSHEVPEMRKDVEEKTCRNRKYPTVELD